MEMKLRICAGIMIMALLCTLAAPGVSPSRADGHAGREVGFRWGKGAVFRPGRRSPSDD